MPQPPVCVVNGDFSPTGVSSGSGLEVHCGGRLSYDFINLKLYNKALIIYVVRYLCHLREPFNHLASLCWKVITPPSYLHLLYTPSV